LVTDIYNIAILPSNDVVNAIAVIRSFLHSSKSKSKLYISSYSTARPFQSKEHAAHFSAFIPLRQKNTGIARTGAPTRLSYQPMVGWGRFELPAARLSVSPTSKTLNHRLSFTFLRSYDVKKAFLLAHSYTKFQ